MRLSAFDFVRFKPDAALSRRENSARIPEEFPLPYPYAFGATKAIRWNFDLTRPSGSLICGANWNQDSQPHRRIALLQSSHPTARRVSAVGWLPTAHDPLIDVARQNQWPPDQSARPKNLIFIGTGYSYLQEYLPHVAQAVFRKGWTDMVGIGRMVLSYPENFGRCYQRGELTPKIYLPHLQRLHHRAAKRHGQRLLSAGSILQGKTGIPEIEGDQAGDGRLANCFVNV